jgi:polyhydroxyalkanoate synthase subunit PhaC
MLWFVILTVTAFNTLIGLAIWFGHLRFWRWRLSSVTKYESVETLPMPDGGLIELRRVAAPHEDGDRVPLLMIHGLAMNHRNHDTHEDYSFARYMHRQGRDVWLVTLRSGRRSFAPFSGANTDFASMVKHDLPGAVAAVLARTRQRQLDLAVFSMGGMLLYAGLERTLEARLVRRVAVFASPAQVRPLGALSFVSILPAALTPSSHLRQYIGTWAFAPRLVPSFVWRRLYNPDNVDRKIERGMLCDVWETIPGRLGADFLRWGANGGTLTVDGQPVLGGLSKVTVPACFFAGTADWLAPAYTVRAGFDAWGRDVPGVEKQFVMLGRAHGTRNDYGHCDIAFGRHVHDEVFAPAARFLNKGVLPEQAHAVPAPTLASASNEPYGVASVAE